MTAPDSDPRPAKRVKDPELLARLHLEYMGEPCEVCELRIGTELHHKLDHHGLARKADDTRENLMWVCGFCHLELHS